MHGPTISRCSGSHKPLATSIFQPGLIENEPPPSVSPSDSEMLSSARTPLKLLRWVHRAARDQGATKLASILLSLVVATNN